MIKVGINENVYIKSLEQDPQTKALNIVFDEVLEKKFNAFEALQQSKVTVVDNSLGVKLFSPNIPTSDKIDTEEKRLKVIERDINKTKGVLIHLLKGYTTEDRWGRIGNELFSGIEIDSNSYYAKIQDQNILTAVYENMVRIFMTEMKEFLNNQDLKFRLLLIRTSKEKHFATFRGGNYIEDQPFWEPMDIPAGDSKIKFSQWELSEGLNDGTPSARSSADNKDKAAKGGDAPAPKSASNIFGKQ